MKRHSLLIGSLAAFALVALTGRPARSADFTVDVVEAARGEASTDGVEIVLRAPEGGARTLQRGAEWYIEFNLDGTSPDSVITIEAYLPDDAEAAEDSTAVPEPVSFWEITPMDHAAGQGGYVRLYLPAELFTTAQDAAGVALRIRVLSHTNSAISAALRSARVIASGSR